MNKFLLVLMTFMSIPLIVCGHGPNKEIFDNYVVETKIELLDTPYSIRYPLIRISWIISCDDNEIRYGSAMIPVWYTVTSMIHESFSDYLLQNEGRVND